MRLRIGVGFVMLGLLVYNLIADAKFCAEFFTLSDSTLFTVGLISAFILPDRFAWPFMAAMATLWLYLFVFARGSGAGGDSDTIPGIVLVIVFYALAFLTYRSAHKPKPTTPDSI